MNMNKDFTFRNLSALKITSILVLKPVFRSTIFSFLFVSFVCLVSFPFQAFSQKSKLTISMNTPEWNGKTYCDNGNGFDPSPINAPGFNYVGTNPNDPKYNYDWEQKINEGNWVEVNAGKQKVVVPAYNPSVLKNDDKQGDIENYQWRLKVTDVANGNQIVSSEVYTLKLAAKLQFTYTATKEDSGNFSIDVNEKGGIGAKRYVWESSDKANPFPADRMHNKNQTGLQPGVYKLTISDQSCKPYSQTITIK